MKTSGVPIGQTLSHERRHELIALSERLRHEHSQLRDASILLRKESRELSEESKLLRTNGRSLEKIVKFLDTPAFDTASP
ncbi:MAG TPA: hypothetical protein VE961_24500 [Pyrinomonadaceae bacterium]|nr:hypothetical protein [Pyrinomonadaceae bacterium]